MRDAVHIVVNPDPTSREYVSPRLVLKHNPLCAGGEAAEDQPRPDVKEEGEVAAEKNSGEPDFSEKHKLEHAWTLWFDNPQGGSKQQATWGQTLRAVYTFSTVEDFWW
jgi:hypothetical protein